MAGKLVQNEQTGEWAMWDGQNLQKLPGRVVTNETSGEKALWDGKALTPIKMDFDMSRPGAEADKARTDSALSANLPTIPQGGGRQASMTVPKPSASNDIVHAINAVPEYVGTEAGKYVQSKVEPYIGGTGSDIAGALVKEGIQFFGPQAGSSLARMGLKTLAKVAPGAQGGKLEQLIDKTRGTLAAGKSKADVNVHELSGLVNRIPESSTAPLPNTLQKVDEIIAYHRDHGITSSPVLADAERLKGLIKQSPARGIKWIDEELTNIGEKTKSVLGQNADPRYKQLFSTLVKDLENTKPVKTGSHTEYAPLAPQPAQPITRIVMGQSGVRGMEPATRQTATGLGRSTHVDDFAQQTGKANLKHLQDPTLAAKGEISHGELVRTKDKAIRRSKGFDDVIDEFNKMVMTKRGSAGAQDINANRLADKLKRDEFLQKSLKTEDWQEIEPLLAKLAETAALPPPSGASFGSGRAMARGSVAGGLAYLFGGDPVSTGAAVTGLDYLAGHMLMSKKGRGTISKILDMNTLEKSQKLNLINAAARIAFEENPEAHKNVKKAPTLQDLGLR